jgi:hypothetical protein
LASRSKARFFDRKNFRVAVVDGLISAIAKMKNLSQLDEICLLVHFKKKRRCVFVQFCYSRFGAGLFLSYFLFQLKNSSP